MTAIGLIFGELTADHYEDAVAADPRIDQLRQKMVVEEDHSFSKDYLDPQKRSIANAVQVFFKDGSTTEKVLVEYPLGHRRRRDEGIPLLIEKFKHHLSKRFSMEQAAMIFEISLNREKLLSMPVHEFVSLWVKDR
jgi:2-methylcitrate dehydratase